jgi:hypothetical protein
VFRYSPKISLGTKALPLPHSSLLTFPLSCHAPFKTGGPSSLQQPIVLHQSSHCSSCHSHLRIHLHYCSCNHRSSRPSCSSSCLELRIRCPIQGHHRRVENPIGCCHSYPGWRSCRDRYHTRYRTGRKTLRWSEASCLKLHPSILDDEEDPFDQNRLKRQRAGLKYIMISILTAVVPSKLAG